MIWLAHNTSSDSDEIAHPSRVHGLKAQNVLGSYSPWRQLVRRWEGVHGLSLNQRVDLSFSASLY